MTLSLFNFDRYQIATYTDSNGDPWFLAKNVCDCLAIANRADAYARLSDSEKMALTPNVGTTDIGSHGGKPPMLVNESGLWGLVFESRKPEAQAFRKWVTSEVLPTLRKTGTYQMQALTVEQRLEQMANDSLAMLADKRQLQAQIEAQKPDVEFAQAIKQSDAEREIGDVANIIGHPCSRPKLFAFLRSEKILFYREKNNVPYQNYIDKGWFRVVQEPWAQMRKDGTIKNGVGQKTVVTGEGEAKIISLWKKKAGFYFEGVEPEYK